jgi:phosphonate transport system substrate-binding protein
MVTPKPVSASAARAPEQHTRNCARRYLRGLLIGVGLIVSQTATALDKRYTDTDNDLVADTPAKTVNPSALLFAYTPGEDPALYPATWNGFLRHLESAVKRPVRFYAAQSNTAQIEAMRAGRLHVAAFGTGAVPLAVNCAGFVPFAIMGGESGILGYEMEVITYPGSGIVTPADIKGRRIVFTSPTSNSGFKVPSVLLRNKFGFESPRDYIAVFAGRHENAVLGVANKDYEAAAIANEVMHRMMARGLVKKEQIVTVYRSDRFPTAGFGLAHNLEPQLATRIREAFFSFAWAGSDLAREFAPLGVSRFMPINYRDDWALVRQIDTQIGARYACR